MRIFPNNTNNVQEKTSFTGRYFVEGSKKAVNNLYEIIKKENLGLHIMTDCCDFSPNAKLILTGDDLKFKSSEMDEESALNLTDFFIKADDVLNKLKSGLRKSIPLFNTNTGLYQTIKAQKIDGMTFYKYANNNLSYGFEKICKFPKKISLTDALKKIDELRTSKAIKNKNEVFYVYAIPEIDKACSAISKTPSLSKLKTNKLLGAGTSSMVFDIGDGKALKLSHKPCYPQKLESFDLPIIEKNYVQEDGIYYCINKKALNYSDTRISQTQIKDLMDEIKAKQYILRPDFNVNNPEQVVILDGKAYLADYDCVLNPDGSSRMFSK